VTIELANSSITDKLEAPNNKHVSLVELGVMFFRIGATSFGGLWGATQKLEKELVHNKSWLTVEEQKALIVAATLIPAPKFLAFGGMVGFRLRKWPGSIVALFAILAPPALLVLTGAIFLNPELLGGPMPTLRRAVGIGVIGLLFGNAFHQLRNAKVPRRQRIVGIALGVSVASAAILGVPLIIAALVGLTLGVCLILPGKEKAQ
jgi:chromate transporter